MKEKCTKDSFRNGLFFELAPGRSSLQVLSFFRAYLIQCRPGLVTFPRQRNLSFPEVWCSYKTLQLSRFSQVCQKRDDVFAKIVYLYDCQLIVYSTVFVKQGMKCISK